MNPAEISKILNEWASALKIDEEGRKRRFSLSDLVRKYSQDVRAEEGKSLMCLLISIRAYWIQD